MAPLGQIKTAPSSPHAHTQRHTHATLTVLSAAPADLCGAYKDYIDRKNGNNGLSKTTLNDKDI